jgi:hypothetical protein
MEGYAMPPRHVEGAEWLSKIVAKLTSVEVAGAQILK